MSVLRDRLPAAGSTDLEVTASQNLSVEDSENATEKAPTATTKSWSPSETVEKLNRFVFVSIGRTIISDDKETSQHGHDANTTETPLNLPKRLNVSRLESAPHTELQQQHWQPEENQWQ